MSVEFVLQVVLLQIVFLSDEHVEVGKMELAEEHYYFAEIAEQDIVVILLELAS